MRTLLCSPVRLPELRSCRANNVGHLEGWPVWSRISSTLKRFGFRFHNFPHSFFLKPQEHVQCGFDDPVLWRLWNDLGSHACLYHRNSRPGTSTEERISGRREPDPESPNQREVVVIRCRKSDAG